MDAQKIAEKFMAPPTEDGKGKAEDVLSDGGLDPVFVENVVEAVLRIISVKQTVDLMLDPAMALAAGVILGETIRAELAAE